MFGLLASATLAFMVFLDFDLEACRSNYCLCEDPITGRDYDSGVKTLGGYCPTKDAVTHLLTNRVSFVIYAIWRFSLIGSYYIVRKANQQRGNDD